MNVTSYVRGFYRMHRLREDPIVIGGCERSGTTLLRAVISAHPAVMTIPYETWGLAGGPKAGFESSTPIRVWRIWKGLGAATWKPGHERWAEKTPANIFYFEKILEHFRGSVHLIECVRDGRDVVTSIHPEDDAPWVPVERWIEAVEAGRELQDHPRVYTVRYEDLVERTLETIEDLYEFLGLPIEGEPEAWISEWHQRAAVRSSQNLAGGRVGEIHSDSVRKWEQPDFPYTDRTKELVNRPRGRSCLEEHGYL